MRSLLAFRPGPPSGEVAIKHLLRILTVFAKAGFWVLCYHYFGSEALLNVVAAWIFVLATKDLTFARVRLSNMVRPEKRRSSLVTSISLEAAILVARAVLILAISQILLSFERTVAAIVAGLILCALFWSRETLITLIRAYRVTTLPKYATFAAAASGLVAVVLFAGSGMGAVDATVGALITREAVHLIGYAVIAVIGRTTRRFRQDPAEDSDEEDDDSGATVAVIGSDGKEIRSTFKIFIGDNVVYSRWRAMQFGSRFVASGLMGPFGGAISRLFFAYRRPGDYVHKDERMPLGKLALVVVALIAMLALGAYAAARFGLLQAFGIAIAAFVLRIVALGLNILMWSRLAVFVGQDVPVPRLRRRKRD